METSCDSSKKFRLLSELVLGSSSIYSAWTEGPGSPQAQIRFATSELRPKELSALEALASSNHVVLRAFEPLRVRLADAGERDAEQQVSDAICRERKRIAHALDALANICSTLENDGCAVTVIKSLDHWPDLGSDIDLYTDAEGSQVVSLMRRHFNATLADRSWGDRLANKWNFIVPGLPELVEVHAGRLGQTGEQTATTRSLTRRSRHADLGGHTFRVPAPEDRILISTLQRMYRHFYIRLCDVVDNARLLDQSAVDLDYLRSLGTKAGIWEGIAAYLVIISQYVEKYRGSGISLPNYVTGAARFGAGQVHYRRNFLRLPLLPHSLNLYAAELRNLVSRGDLRNGFRLSLLPCLATAAALEMKLTGSDKGIW